MDLNTDFEQKILPTKSELYKYVTDVDVYRFYTKFSEIKLKGGYKSPLREDNNPSFGFFQKNGEIRFKDFLLGSGDCIQLVMMMYDLDYNSALSKIILDFKLQDKFIVKSLNYIPTRGVIHTTSNDTRSNILSEKFTTIDVKFRKWNKNDSKFWLTFNINKAILDRYNVKAISHFYINGQIYKADILAYCYLEFKDNIVTKKIYQPFNNNLKWLGDFNDSVWQGWNQLTWNNKNNLIITKSLKDIMSLANSISNVDCVSLHNEKILPKPHIIKQLYTCYGDNIWVLYDNDYDKDKNWGQLTANKLCDRYNFKNIIIPARYESKDFSDLVKNIGVNEAVDILKILMNQSSLNLELDDLPF